MMASHLEQHLNRALRELPADLKNGTNLLESERLDHILSGLEHFIPEVLSEIYSEWKHESLDGFHSLMARKTGDAEIEFLGLCILITEQKFAAVHVHVQASPTTDDISWFECRLGERGPNGMVRANWEQEPAMRKRLRAVDGNVSRIDWVYRVTFGRRRP